jgi:hypothetical protein
MDGDRFDTLLRALGSSASRRGVLAALAGMCGLGLVEVSAKRRRGNRGRVPAASAGQDKVTICHHDGQGRIRRITVAERAVQAHLDHGDVVYNGCCTDTECNEGDGGAGGLVCHRGTCCQPATCGRVCTCDTIDQGCGLGLLNCAEDCPDDLICVGPPGRSCCTDASRSECPVGLGCTGDGGDGGGGGGGGGGGDGGGGGGCISTGNPCVDNPECCSGVCGSGFCRNAECGPSGTGCNTFTECCAGNCCGIGGPGVCCAENQACTEEGCVAL